VESVGGAKKGFMALENYNNVIIISADRNGSTAFQQTIFNIKQNQDSHHVWLGECFSNDASKGLPNSWHNPNVSPADVIEHFNKGTGKGAYLKIQITWPNFNKLFFDIPAQRKIFLHRNLFDSTLSRCVAQLTGKWFTYNDSKKSTDRIVIDKEFFLSRFEYRLDRYLKHIDQILEWKNEYYRYENYNYESVKDMRKNRDKKDVVINYDELFDIYQKYSEIEDIEKCLNLPFGPQ